MTKPSTPTKAELHEMLAEAVRNTQPQPVNTQPGPVRDVRPDPKHKKAASQHATRAETHGQNQKRSCIC